MSWFNDIDAEQALNLLVEWMNTLDNGLEDPAEIAVYNATGEFLAYHEWKDYTWLWNPLTNEYDIWGKEENA
jgi:hypothetical protein